MASHPLLDVPELAAVEPHLRAVGTVFAVFDQQDSGCVSRGVRLPGGERWLVKEATTPEARRSLDRAAEFHAAVRHPAIVPHRHRIRVAGGHTAVVMPWRDGSPLYHRAADSGLAAFRALPLPAVLRAVDRVLDAHLAVERAGFVAVDFYDGALLHDFGRGEIQLIDLDEYRPGPFTLDAPRLPGSLRFMAPEELRRGARITARTTVFTLGRAARLLLDAGDAEREWRGTGAQLAVLARATRPEPGERFGSVAQFVAAWRGATPESAPRRGR